MTQARFAFKNRKKDTRVLLADPPWPERGGGKIKRGADRHYDLLSTGRIMEVMEDSGWFDRLMDDAHVYLWVTNTFLPDGLKVMDYFGIRYVTNVCWVKPHFGLGQYFRGQHELLLFGVKGKGYVARTEARTIPSVIHAPRTKHSQKPEESYQMIEERSTGPYVELFARRPRKGWSVWGNEVSNEDRIAL